MSPQFPSISLLLCALSLASLAGCERSTRGDTNAVPSSSIARPPLESDNPVTLTLSSPAFADGMEIPARFTCQGDNVSPPLAWKMVPAGAMSLALVVDDPDAPDPRAPKTTWVHWVVFGIPTQARGLLENSVANALPPGTREGLNDWKKIGYGGPCPPIGRHRYVHKLYALDIAVSGLAQPTKAELEAAMKGHILAEARLVGTYEKR
jgi:Raf kinase inhibitor-like YbhB/YbcL family protein